MSGNIIAWSPENTEMLVVHANGDVYWRKDGLMVKAEVDAELAQAFWYVVHTMLADCPATMEGLRAALRTKE